MTAPAGRDAPLTQKLWNSLRRADEETGITVAEAARKSGASEAMTRRKLRLWAEAGYLRVENTGGETARRIYRLLPEAPRQAPVIGTDGSVAPREGAMSAAQFAALRRRLGLSRVQLGRLLGWTGKHSSVSRAISRFEEGLRPIDAALAARIRALPENPAEAQRLAATLS